MNRSWAFLSENENGLWPLLPLGEVALVRDISSNGNIPRKGHLALKEALPSQIIFEGKKAVVILLENGSLERIAFGTIEKKTARDLIIWHQPGQENPKRIDEISPGDVLEVLKASPGKLVERPPSVGQAGPRTTSVYSDAFLEALGAWQRGWSEDPIRRGVLSEALKAQVTMLPQEVRRVSHECYRKRFLYDGELGSIMLADGGLDEGFASWTQDPKFAHRFHGFHRPEAITAAIFAHTPASDEILLNTVLLWDDIEFRRALDHFVSRNGPNSDALMNFKATQGEVILHVPLRWNEIVGLSGVGDALDDIADAQGILESARAPILRDLMETGIYPGEPRWIWGNRAHLLLNRTRNRVVDMINAALEGKQEAPSGQVR